MTTRQNILTGTVWEERIGFSRAVRVGNLVFVSGTIGADEAGNIQHVGSAFDQTMAAFAKAERAMIQAGSSRKDVVRTRMYITRIEDADAVGKAHKAFFGDVMPVATMVQVTAFVAKEALVEVEVDAITQNPASEEFDRQVEYDAFKYHRGILDARERWGLLFSLTAIGLVTAFLADRVHTPELNWTPAFVGVLGFIFVFVSSCYHKENRARFNAQRASRNWTPQPPHRGIFGALQLWKELRVYGWLHNVVPLLIGLLATVVLYRGGLVQTARDDNSNKSLSTQPLFR